MAIPSRPGRIVAAAMGLLVAALAPLPGARAQSPGDVPDDPIRGPVERVFAPWKEEAPSPLPPLPAPDRLFELQAAGGDGSPYRYFLDLEHLTLGRDGVVRYTVVLRSATVENIFREGLRCETGEYRTYGYATGRDRALRPGGSARWRRMSLHGRMNYRWVLYQELLCDESARALPPRAIRERAARAGLDADIDPGGDG